MTDHSTPYRPADNPGGAPNGAFLRPPRQPMFNVPPATLGLLSLVTAVFAFLQIVGHRLEWSTLLYFSVVPTRIAAALADPLRLDSLMAGLTLLTHAALHADAMHFIVNAGFLLAFGSGCERAMGRSRFLWLVLASAAGGAVAQIIVDWNQQVVMYGASGVVSGCMGGFARLLLSGGADLDGRRPGLALIGSFLAMNLLFGLFGPGLVGLDTDIAWEAHIGGFLAGLATARRRPRAPLARPV